MRIVALATTVAVVAFGCAIAPRHDGPASAHFDGVHFRNSIPGDKTIVDIISFVSTFWLRKESWPQRVENEDHPPPPESAPGRVVVTFVNHSTVLLQFAGFNVLTDPIWAERASPLGFLGPRRVRDPGLTLAALPPLDVVLVSHDHYDHLDVETLRQLAARGRDGPPLLLSGLATGDVFERHGILNYRELDWGDSVTFGAARITFVETRHRSGRGLTDQMKTLWGGFVIEHPDARVYFAGDSGYGPHFRAAREAWGAFDLAFIPIGAYRPRWFMAPQHLDPAGAVQAHRDLGSGHSIAIHHGTFQLTYEPIDEPYRELARARVGQGVAADEFQVLGFGESVTLSFNRGRGAIVAR